jgi:hypothetical protein
MRLGNNALFNALAALSRLCLADAFPSSSTNHVRVPHGTIEAVNSIDLRGSTEPLNFTSYLHRRQITSPEWLRIMPLGASIVAGSRSTPQDGFRKPLRDHLRSLGFKVNMVGSQ